MMKRLLVLFFGVVLVGCASNQDHGSLAVSDRYYGASEYCLNLKKRATDDLSNQDNYRKYQDECEFYGGTAPPKEDQNTECILNMILGGSCSEAYEKWE
jgi:hypothetical protein